MQQHKNVVNRHAELDTAIEKEYDYLEPGSRAFYFATIEDPTLLNAIRADTGVDLVGCDRYLDLSGFLRSEGFEISEDP